MKQLVLVIALAGTLLVSEANASDYCWVITPEVPEAFRKAKAVFIGEVIEIGGPLSSKPGAPLAERYYRIKFKVAYSWKGAGFREFGVPEIVLLSDQGGGCFSWGTFLEGHKYLVYADETAQKDLTVQLGKRTASLANAEEDVKELDRMARPSLRLPPRSRTKEGAPTEFLPKFQLLGSRLNVSIATSWLSQDNYGGILP